MNIHWVARDSNGKLIRQFDENGEHYLPELPSKLISIGYYDENNDKYYLCSLSTGTFYFPDDTIETDHDIGNRQYILERRHSITGDQHAIKYIFGFIKNGKRYITDINNRKIEIT